MNPPRTQPFLLAMAASVLLGACAAPVTVNEPRTQDEPVTVQPVAAETVGPRAEASVTPAPSATPRPTRAATSRPPPNPTPAPLEPFAFGLYEEGDWVQQQTFEWCVAASVQMAWNLTRPDVRNDRSDQGALWELARDRSNNPFRGADPGGWTILLNELGLGPYELVSIPDYDEALRVAARAMRETSRSVGLVMWRGRHAWVMSGFESLGDPAVRDDFQVTGVRIVDPLYPWGSGIWGPSPEPNALLSTDELAKQFVFREQRRWSSDIPAGYLLVLPTMPEPAADRPEARRPW